MADSFFCMKCPRLSVPASRAGRLITSDRATTLGMGWVAAAGAVTVGRARVASGKALAVSSIAALGAAAGFGPLAPSGCMIGQIPATRAGTAVLAASSGGIAIAIQLETAVAAAARLLCRQHQLALEAARWPCRGTARHRGRCWRSRGRCHVAQGACEAIPHGIPAVCAPVEGTLHSRSHFFWRPVASALPIRW